MANLVVSRMVAGSRATQFVGAAADTLDLTDMSMWMPLAGVGGFAVYAEADAGATISTAVNAVAYVKNPVTGRPARAELFDCTGNTATGGRTNLIGSLEVTSDVGWVAYQPNGGAVSVGSLGIQIVPSGKPGAGEVL